MTPQTQNTCLELLAGMLSPTQPWSEPTGSLYAYVMQNWSDDIALESVKHAAAHEQFRPSPATLRQIAAKLATEAAGPIPSITALRQEIRKLVVWHGERAASARHSHPLVSAIVEEMGNWRSMGRMNSDQVDDAFPAAYQRAVKHLYDEVASTLLHLPASERQGKLLLCAHRKTIPTALILEGAGAR